MKAVGGGGGGGGRPGLPVPNSLYGLCGRKATLNSGCPEFRSCVKVEVAVLGSPVPNSPYGLCGRTEMYIMRLRRVRVNQTCACDFVNVLVSVESIHCILFSRGIHAAFCFNVKCKY